MARAETADGERALDLVRGPDGTWSRNGRALSHVQGALDCDLALSPLTNFMPARRLGEKAADHVMAWVSVPDLEVLRSEQRYEPVSDGVVRYVGLDHDFTAELELDEHGFVVRYPDLAERASLEALDRRRGAVMRYASTRGARPRPSRSVRCRGRARSTLACPDRQA